MSTHKQKTKRKINKLNVWAIIVSGIAMFAFLCLVIGIVIINSMLNDKPTLNLEDFEQTESSVIYDCNDQEIANLGTVIRQNVEYSQIPNVVVNAFVAIEDSRFFEHNGFDIPRFTKAMIEDIIAMDFEQGGSTFTMQLVKNTYFTNDETGQSASRSGISGIKRKVCEIALALELEKYESKQFIFESYVNKLNFGGDRNIRGIQKASQYYFGKDVEELNINEAALLAGVINAPNYYNPFYNLEAAQEREETVLYQMYHHGYITQQEYELAKSVRVEDLLVDPYSSNGEGEGIAYQAYIDAVVNETIELTGLDPYTTTMHIYTYMIPEIQNTMDAIQSDNIKVDDDGNTFISEAESYIDEDGNIVEYESYMQYPDDYMEIASVCINNSTGEVVGILGGRNYADGGQLLLNHATEQYKQPGSSIKPILDYALAFENLGWATDHVLTDAPQYMDSSHLNLVYNFSGKYVGDVTLTQAVGESINTCAIQTLQAVLDKMKYEYVVNYCQSLGYEFSLDDFNVQYGVGGSTCEVTPYQHAAAYAAIMNYGTYNTPHTVKRIEFTNGKSPITPTYSSNQVISDAAAYLTTELMYSNVQSYGGSYSYLKNNDYVVYGKTGTTDWGTEGAEYGIPSGSNKDCWMIACTTEYTTATWIGYEKAVLGQPSYVTDDVYYNVRPQARIAHLILDACYKYGESEPSKLTKPSGVTSVTHILGTWPYASTNIEGVTVDSSLITTGLAKSGSVSLVTLTPPTITASPTGSKMTIANGDTNNATVIVDFTEYPDESALEIAGTTKDQSLKDNDGNIIIASEGKVLFDYSWIYGPIQYCADVTVKYDDKTTKTFSYAGSDDTATINIGNTMDGAEVSCSMYYKYENANISSEVTNETDSIKVADKSIYIPKQNASKSDVIATCTQYSITYKEIEMSDYTDDEYFKIYIDGVETTDYGKTKTVKKSAVITCEYYVKPIASIAFSISGNSFKVGKNYTLSAYARNCEIKSYKWSTTGDVSFDDNTAKNPKVTIGEDAAGETVTITLTAETDRGKLSYSLDININE